MTSGVLVGVSQRGGSEALAGGAGPRGGRLRSGLLKEPALLVFVAAMALLDAIASVIRDVNLGSGLDLSLFDQAVWHYSRFQAPFGCFEVAVNPFRRQQAVLARAIHAARPALRGACSQLATAALETTHVLVLDLTRAASAASSPDRTALPAALARANTDDTNLDLTGQLERYLILCTPR
jgi:hypothetical protein